ncbi:MAG: bifunctional metallophosphatase/5'-nucleotidase [Deltaproteobacteria bacterium]|nr:bifunctional metallophosphatase/5'-nucleotidase [Deltaproteobacteria bacterium]
MTKPRKGRCAATLRLLARKLASASSLIRIAIKIRHLSYFAALALAATFSLCLAACASKTVDLAAPASSDGDVVILTTTDFHSTLDRAEALFNEVTKLRERFGRRALHLDGGDLFQGSLEGNLNKGESIVKFYNLLGVDAAAMGNHELDYGPDVPGRSSVNENEDGLGNLKRRLKEARFAWLSANFVKDSPEDSAEKCDPTQETHCNALGQRTLFRPRTVFERSGSRVCVFGATTPTTPRITNALFIRGMKFVDLKTIVTAEVEFLRAHERCDFTILMIHAGLNCDRSERCLEPGDLAEVLTLLNALPPRYLSAVVAGHTHLRAREIINGVPVIEAGCYAQQVGVLHLYKTREPRFEDWIMTPEKARAPRVTVLLKPYREAAFRTKSRTVGSAKAPFIRSYLSENAMGNLLADALLDEGRARAHADFALLNAGGVRSDLPSGPIVFGDVFKVMPFDNSLAIIELKGTELLRLLEIAYSGANGMPPLAGLRIRKLDVRASDTGPWDRDLNGDGKKETWERNLLLNVYDASGEPLDGAGTYTLATIDFLVYGAEHQDTVYKPLPHERVRIYSGTWVRDLLEKYLKKHPNADPAKYFDPAMPRIELTSPD